MEQHSTVADLTLEATPDYKYLIDRWIAIWNGDYTDVDAVVAQDFRVHSAMMDGGDGSAVRGAAGLVDWIAQIRAAFTELVFSVEVGPIIERDHLALRWVAVGTYGGGFPGATAPAGTPIRFTGTDLLRIEQRKLAEYWLNSDVHVLLASLGVSLGTE